MEPSYLHKLHPVGLHHQSNQCFYQAVYQYVSSSFSFPFPNPISRSSAPLLCLPTLLPSPSPGLLPPVSSKSLHLCSLDKNNFFFFCLVPHKSLCVNNKLLSRRLRSVFWRCQSTHASKKKKKNGGKGNGGGIRNKQQKKK